MNKIQAKLSEDGAMINLTFGGKFFTLDKERRFIAVNGNSDAFACDNVPTWHPTMGAYSCVDDGFTFLGMHPALDVCGRLFEIVVDSSDGEYDPGVPYVHIISAAKTIQHGARLFRVGRIYKIHDDPVIGQFIIGDKQIHGVITMSDLKYYSESPDYHLKYEIVHR